MKVPDRIEPQVRAVVEFFQDQWFDRTRNVQTAGEVSLRSAGVDAVAGHDSEAYQPARPAHIRRALRQIPVDDVSEFAFVDLGSGKGRTLFIAAERPFRSIVGVELTPVLHAAATRNVQRFRARKKDRERILPLQQNAIDFIFPDEKMVLYMFNPFGRETVREVLRNLAASLRQRRRHVVVVLLWPQWADEVARMDGMELRTATKEYRIYEANHGVA